jgi:anti-sigma factor RsiW
MDCGDADLAFDALLDGEAPLATQRQVLAHLEECAACRQELAYRQLLQQAIRQGGEVTEMPPRLWERIGTGLDEIDCLRRMRQRRQHWRARQAGSAAAVAVLIGVFLGYWLLWPPASPFMAESVDNYIRYLLSNAPYDLQTPNADRVRQWFQGRLDFVAEPPDLSGEGFELLGTRLGYFLDRVVAEMGYQRDGHRLSLFMTKGKGIEALAGERVSFGGNEFFITTSKGYTVVAWRDEAVNIVCSIVADLGQETLLRIARKAAGVRS